MYTTKFRTDLHRVRYAHVHASEAKAKALPPDEARQWRPAELFARDAEQRSLMVRLYRSGKRTFMTRARLSGTGAPRPVMLGDVDGDAALTYEAALAKAAAVFAQLRAGTNPTAERRCAEQEAKAAHGAVTMTLRQVLEGYLSHTTATDASEVSRNVTVYLADWLDTPLLSITQAMWMHAWGEDGRTMWATCRARAQKASKNYNGKKTAKNVRSHFTRLWNWYARMYGDDVRAAKGHAMPPCPNFVARAPKKVWGGKAKKRSHIQATNVGQLLRVLSTYRGNPHHAFLYYLALATGMRSVEAKNLQWCRRANADHNPAEYGWIAEAGHTAVVDGRDVHYGPCIVLPGEFTKTGDAETEFVIPLTPNLQILLKSLRAHNAANFEGEPAWLFPSRSASGHIEANNNAFRRVGAHAGMKLDMHSTRHMFRDALRAVGATSEEQDALLNQVTPGMAAVYGQRADFGRHTELLTLVDTWYARQRDNLPLVVETNSISVVATTSRQALPMLETAA